MEPADRRQRHLDRSVQQTPDARLIRPGQFRGRGWPVPRTGLPWVGGGTLTPSTLACNHWTETGSHSPDKRLRGENASTPAQSKTAGSLDIDSNPRWVDRQSLPDDTAGNHRLPFQENLRMAPEITTAHCDVLGHLRAFESLGVIPAALAGHYPHGSDQADLPIDWLVPFPVFAHPADPARLLVGVYTHEWILVALDHIAHRDCDHRVCSEVFTRRRRELAEIPTDALLFATQPVETTWSPSDLPYLVHIEDYQAAQAQGWTGTLTEYIELS